MAACEEKPDGDFDTYKYKLATIGPDYEPESLFMMPLAFVDTLRNLFTSLSVVNDSHVEVLFQHYTHVRHVTSMRPHEEVMFVVLMTRYINHSRVDASHSGTLLCKLYQGHESSLLRQSRMVICAVVYLVLCQSCEDCQDYTGLLRKCCFLARSSHAHSHAGEQHRKETRGRGAKAGSVLPREHPRSVEILFNIWRDNPALKSTRDERVAKFEYTVMRIAGALEWRMCSETEVHEATPIVMTDVVKMDH